MEAAARNVSEIITAGTRNSSWSSDKRTFRESFSTAGLVLQAKRSSLAPENVNKIIFVHHYAHYIHSRPRTLGITIRFTKDSIAFCAFFSF
jgi:hypothetical protein